MTNPSTDIPINLYQILEKLFVRPIPGKRSTVFTGFTAKRNNRILHPSLIINNGIWCFYNKDNGKKEYIRLDDFVRRYRAGTIRYVRARYDDDGTPSMITLSDIQRTAEFAKVLDGAALTVNTNTGDASDSSSEPMETDSSPAGPGIDPANESFSDIDSSSNGQATSIEDFQVQLDRRSIIGATGERIAFEDEIRRLRSKEVGCPDPERHVNHIALSDVARGYDIESTWPGQERCIEVKSSTSASNPIFMSSNERAVLEKLGKKAWVYRVIIDTDGNGQVTLRLNDPISIIPEENFSTAVWAVRLPKADQ